MRVIVRGENGTIRKHSDGPTWVYLELGTNQWRAEPAIRLLGKPYHKGKSYARWKDPDFSTLGTEGLNELRELLEPEGTTTTLTPIRCLCAWCRRNPQEAH